MEAESVKTCTKDLNTPAAIKLRRYRNNLAMSGAAYIMFGIWAVIEILAEITMDSNSIREMKDAFSMEELTDSTVRIFLVVFFLIMFAIILAVHLKVGISAIRYSLGKKRSWAFLIFAFLLALISADSIAETIEKVPEKMMRVHKALFVANPGIDAIKDVLKEYEALLAGVAVDLTVIFVLLDMIFSVVMICRLVKLQKREEGQ